MGTLMKNLAETSGENEPFQKCVFCARIASTKSKKVALCSVHYAKHEQSAKEIDREYEELMKHKRPDA